MATDLPLLGVFLINLLYTVAGLILGLIGAFVAFRVFDKLTPFPIVTELQRANLAVGVVVGAMFIMIGLIVGLVVGMGLN